MALDLIVYLLLCAIAAGLVKRAARYAALNGSRHKSDASPDWPSSHYR